MLCITMVTMPVTTAGKYALPTHLINHGTAVNKQFRQVAASIGTAICVSVLSVVTKGATPSASGKVLDPKSTTNAMHQATLSGYRAALSVSLVMAALGLVQCFFCNNDAMDRRHPSSLFCCVLCAPCPSLSRWYVSSPTGVDPVQSLSAPV